MLLLTISHKIRERDCLVDHVARRHITQTRQPRKVHRRHTKIKRIRINRRVSHIDTCGLRGVYSSVRKIVRGCTMRAVPCQRGIVIQSPISNGVSGHEVVTFSVRLAAKLRREVLRAARRVRIRKVLADTLPQHWRRIAVLSPRARCPPPPPPRAPPPPKPPRPRCGVAPKLRLNRMEI